MTKKRRRRRAVRECRSGCRRSSRAGSDLPASTALLIHGKVIRFARTRRTDSCSQTSWRLFRRRPAWRAARAGSAIRTQRPTKSDSSGGVPSSSAWMPPHMAWPMHNDVAHAQDAHREFDRRAHAVRLVVRPVGRHQVGDVADDEQLAGRGIEHHLRIGAAIRAGDDERAGILAAHAQFLEPSVRCDVRRESGDSRRSIGPWEQRRYGEIHRGARRRVA